MPDLLQRAFGALWRLFMTLWMFGDGYIISAAQFDPVSTFVTSFSWLLYLYILFFPTSSIVARFVPVFDLLEENHIIVLVSVLAIVLLFRSLFQRSPLGVLCVVAFSILEVCRIQRVAYRASTTADTCKLPEPPQAGAAAAEAEGSDHTTADAVYEANLAAEQEQPIEPEQSDSAEPTDSQPEVEATKSRALGAMKILWSFLRLVVALGALTVVAHFLIDAQLKSWAVNTAPIDGSPVFEAEVIIQANKTELPIPVPLADFIPTATFGSPCQAAPTPTPIAKSTQAWIGTAMSTPMPTPIPEPTPTATPEPEPVPAHIKPNDANRLFDFELPDPTPILKWYFSLPPSSQYTVIVISLMVLWCLSKPLIILAAHLAVLAIAYFFSAAVIALLLVYGFTTEQSIAISLPADFALIGSLWWVIFRLKNLAAASNTNAASLAELRCLLATATKSNDASLSELRCLLQESIKYIKSGMDDMTELIQRLQDVIDFVNRTIKRVNEHETRFTDHANDINHLGKEVNTKADLEQTKRILEKLHEKIADLETSKADAPLLREVQRKVDSLRRLAENTRKEKADATELEAVRMELKRMIDLVDEMKETKEDRGDLTELTKRLDEQAATVAGMLTSQDKLTKVVEEQKTNLGIARADITTLSEASNRYDSSISNLENRAKELERKANDHNSQIPNDRKNAKERMAKIEEENVSLKQDVDKLQRHVTDMQNRMAAIETGHGQHREDMQKLQHDVIDTDQKVNKLRSDTDSQHDQVTRTHNDFAATVNTRLTDSDKAVNQAKEQAQSGLDKQGKWVSNEVSNVTGNIRNDFHEHTVNTDKNFVDSSMRIDGLDESISNILQRVEAIESQQNGSIPQLGADESTRDRFDQYMEDFLVSMRFRAALENTQLTLKKQSKRDLMRAEVRDVTHEVLYSEDFQNQIFAYIMDRRAHENNLLLGDSPAVGSDGRASPDQVEPSTSPAASDNTAGNDDPLGDSPGVVNGGQATLPGDMSSDDTTSPIIPEESAIPGDVDDHHVTRGVPPGEPPGANLRGRSTSLVGSTSDGASDDDGTGSRPSGESDDDTPKPKQWEVKEPRESGHLTDERAHDPAIRKQPGGEQEEETDEEKTDDEADDDGDDNSDDDDSDDDDPSGPPPGSGGFHGHDGTGDDDDDDEDGDNGGAPRPFTGLGASRSAPGLASSRYASSPLSGSGDFHGNNRIGGNDDEAHDRDGGRAPGPFSGLGDSRHNTDPSSGPSNSPRAHNQNDGTGGASHNNDARPNRKKAFEVASERQKLRRSKHWTKKKGEWDAGKEEKKQENLKKQERNEPTQLQNPPAQRQPQPTQRQGQAMHWQNGPTQGHGQPTYWQNGPTYGQNQPSQRQNQPLQSQSQPVQRQGQPMYSQNGPAHRQNQQTGDGQEQ